VNPGGGLDDNYTDIFYYYYESANKLFLSGLNFSWLLFLSSSIFKFCMILSICYKLYLNGS